MDILKNKNLKQSKFTVNIYCGGGGGIQRSQNTPKLRPNF